ncbi:hypothetical protein [Solimicrobium silvestre]|uniref:NHL repeat n=1 Tax=Solimicrobium silvestre TaxID=2099400 RepID=A0A2S9GVH5_9BURK|nr:hypothetical protein [Solimicrobium silvestre]PRC91729.1 NHL repeat [Solimicrobium silvestre]
MRKILIALLMIICSTLCNFSLAAAKEGTLIKIGDISFGNGLPVGLASDKIGNIYIADFFKNQILKINRDKTTVVIAGDGKLGYRDGSGKIARFSGPSAIAIDDGGNVIVADSGNNLIRKISKDGIVSTVAGEFEWYKDPSVQDRNGARDGAATKARFNYPQGVAVDSRGNIYVSDSQSQRIRLISPKGIVSTLSGISTWYRIGYVDGTASNAVFYYPEGLAFGSDGFLYVADNNAIRKIAPDGSVSTLAGGQRARIAASKNEPFKYTGGNIDGAPQIAEFAAPVALAIDNQGNIYVADENNKAIRKVAPDGNTTTLLDLSKYYPADTNPPTARSGAPIGITMLPDGSLVICVPGGIYKYSVN